MKITKDKTSFGALVKINEAELMVFGKKTLEKIRKASLYLKDELPDDVFIEITRGYKSDKHPSSSVIAVPTKDANTVLFIAKKIPQNIQEKFFSIFQIKNNGLYSTKHFNEVDLTRAGEAAYENLKQTKGENVFFAITKYFSQEFKKFNWR